MKNKLYLLFIPLLLITIFSALANDEPSDDWLGLSQGRYVSTSDTYDDFGFHGFNDQPQVRHYYSFFNDEAGVEFQDSAFNQQVTQGLLTVDTSDFNYDSVVTIHRYVASPGNNVLIVALDKTDKMLISIYDNVGGSFSNREIDVDTEFGIDIDSDLWVADLNGNNIDEVILRNGSLVVGFEYIITPPYLEQVYSLDVGVSIAESQGGWNMNSDDLLDIESFNGINYLAFHEEGGADDIFLYRVGVTGGVPYLVLLAQDTSSTTRVEDLLLISFLGTDVSLIYTDDDGITNSDVNVISDYDGYNSVHSLTFDAGSDLPYYIFPMNLDADSTLEILLAEDASRNFAVIDFSTPISFATSFKTADGYMESIPFAAEVNTSNSGHELCSLDGTQEAGNFSVSCWNFAGTLQLRTHIINFDDGSILNSSDTDNFDFCKNEGMLTFATVKEGSFTSDREIIVTPSFSFWVDSSGAFTVDDSLYFDNWHGGVCPDWFGLTYLDDNSYPDILAFQGDTLRALMNIDAPEAADPTPAIGSIALVNDPTCLNDTIAFDITMSSVPDDGFLLQVDCNGTSASTTLFNESPVITTNALTITCDNTLDYWQSTGTKLFTIQAQNALSGETGAIKGLNFDLRTPYICNDALLGINFSDTGVIPTFTWISQIPANPVLSDTTIEFNYFIEDTDQGNFTLKEVDDLQNPVITITQHDTADFSGLNSLIVQRTVAYNDIQGSQYFWRGLEIYPQGFESELGINQVSTTIPSSVIAELYSITEEEIITFNWELPSWFDDKPYIRAVPVIVCENPTCFGVPAQTENGSATSYDDEGDPTNDPLPIPAVEDALAEPLDILFNSSATIKLLFSIALIIGVMFSAASKSNNSPFILGAGMLTAVLCTVFGWLNGFILVLILVILVLILFLGKKLTGDDGGG